jgi:hypothetical protein
MRGAIIPRAKTPSWRGAQSKHRDNFMFTFTLAVQEGGSKPADDYTFFYGNGKAIYHLEAGHISS